VSSSNKIVSAPPLSLSLSLPIPHPAQFQPLLRESTINLLPILRVRFSYGLHARFLPSKHTHTQTNNTNYSTLQALEDIESPVHEDSAVGSYHSDAAKLRANTRTGSRDDRD
jgi:hypothetical protein